MLKHRFGQLPLGRRAQPPSGGCVLKRPAADRAYFALFQPPSGGCVLKLCRPVYFHYERIQPPSGGCVLKRVCRPGILKTRIQPPSGGCVLKLYLSVVHSDRSNPAAFRRLCVETPPNSVIGQTDPPAAFRRLCVETAYFSKSQSSPAQPPSGGCVLKLRQPTPLLGRHRPAAFRRLCVETLTGVKYFVDIAASRLQAAVC